MTELIDLTYAGAERWTCTGCLAALSATAEGNHICPECGATVRCTYERVEMSECRSELVEGELSNFEPEEWTRAFQRVQSRLDDLRAAHGRSAHLLQAGAKSRRAVVKMLLEVDYLVEVAHCSVVFTSLAGDESGRSEWAQKEQERRNSDMKQDEEKMPKRLWALTTGIQPEGGRAGIWRSDVANGTEYVRADLVGRQPIETAPTSASAAMLNMRNLMAFSFAVGGDFLFARKGQFRLY